MGSLVDSGGGDDVVDEEAAVAADVVDGADADGGSEDGAEDDDVGRDGGGAERVMTMLRRSLSGRNLGGIESHVLRPMMTVLTAPAGACMRGERAPQVSIAIPKGTYTPHRVGGQKGKCAKP